MTGAAEATPASELKVPGAGGVRGPSHLPGLQAPPPSLLQAFLPDIQALGWYPE